MNALAPGHREWTRDGLVVTTDPGRFDVAALHAFLDTSYCAKGRTRAVVEKSIEARSMEIYRPA